MEDTGFALGRETIQMWAEGVPVEATGRRLNAALRVVGILVKTRSDELHSLTDEDQRLYLALGHPLDAALLFLENSHEHGRGYHLESIITMMQHNESRVAWHFVSTLRNHPSCTDEILSRLVVYGWYGSPVLKHTLVLSRLAEEGGDYVKTACRLATLLGPGSGNKPWLVDQVKQVGDLGPERAEIFRTVFEDVVAEHRTERHRSELVLSDTAACINLAIDMAKRLAPAA